ncbi:uncharacterized protein [Chelonus insularis]|uniref:uncharacterized protein n=1 Tax=Chelonus insularis TaxID=460826 RepID=UPI00158BC61E|nr:uncharacterized protein LOC118065709 [Chelonus insularis]
MPHPCVVCGRSRMNPNNREEEYMFFGFPVNYETRCKKWLEFCGREDLYKLTKKQLLQRMVCSKHFEEKDFLNEYFDRLNCTAVPSIYDPKQSLYNITCVLCGRFRKDPPDPDYDGTTFHHFPGEEFRCLKWLEFVGVDSYYRLTRKEILYCYICSHHFDKSQFMPGYRNRLIDNAVPNIRYPDQLNGTEEFISEALCVDSKPSPEKLKKLDPLPPEVLESQACAACGRSRSDPRNRVEKYKFHPFPAYEIGRCLRWCQFLGREDLLKMSPNQIRKLVLCSKHFPSGQPFQKTGPCDAVPTIKDITDTTFSASSLLSTEESDSPLVEINDATNEEQVEMPEKRRKRKNHSISFVSSKKPFVANKPTPLAKKRGKSRRPTLINIPKPQTINIDNRVLRKLPLPPASRNCDIWKFQIPNQIQPITIQNHVTSIPNVNTADVKKVVLPFTGNISNLGKPIPVSSLSSIPPGLLIKIDLPEATNSQRGKKKQTRRKKQNNVNLHTQLPEDRPKRERKHNRKLSQAITQNTLHHEEIEDPSQTDLTDLLMYSPVSKLNMDRPSEGIENEEVVVESIVEDEDYHEAFKIDGEESADMNLMLESSCSEMNSCEDLDMKSHIYNSIPSPDEFEFVKCEVAKTRKMMSARAKRTLLPITNEVRRFLKKLQPQMRRLPRRARAQLKLSIVTMVIDRL